VTLIGSNRDILNGGKHATETRQWARNSSVKSTLPNWNQAGSLELGLPKELDKLTFKILGACGDVDVSELLIVFSALARRVFAAVPVPQHGVRFALGMVAMMMPDGAPMTCDELAPALRIISEQANEDTKNLMILEQIWALAKLAQCEIL